MKKSLLFVSLFLISILFISSCEVQEYSRVESKIEASSSRDDLSEIHPIYEYDLVMDPKMCILDSMEYMLDYYYENNEVVDSGIFFDIYFQKVWEYVLFYKAIELEDYEICSAGEFQEMIYDAFGVTCEGFFENLEDYQELDFLYDYEGDGDVDYLDYYYATFRCDPCIQGGQTYESYLEVLHDNDGIDVIIDLYSGSYGGISNFNLGWCYLEYGTSTGGIEGYYCTDQIQTFEINPGESAMVLSNINPPDLGGTWVNVYLNIDHSGDECYEIIYGQYPSSGLMRNYILHSLKTEKYFTKESK